MNYLMVLEAAGELAFGVGVLGVRLSARVRCANEGVKGDELRWII